MTDVSRSLNVPSAEWVGFSGLEVPATRSWGANLTSPAFTAFASRLAVGIWITLTIPPAASKEYRQHPRLPVGLIYSLME
jgi:hypothetical protein